MSPPRTPTSPPAAPPPAQPTRRRVLGALATAAGVGALPAPLLGCIPRPAVPPYLEVTVEQGRILIPVARYPQLLAPGGALTLKGAGLAQPLLVLHASDPDDPNGFAVVAATCTHEACPLAVDEAGIVCPCHASRFGTDGSVQHPPATANLLTFGISYSPSTQELTIHLAQGNGLPAPVQGVVRLAFTDFPALTQPGGSVEGTPQGASDALLVLALPSGGFAAYNPLCTHAQCALVEYQPSTAALRCPCHGSLFALDGSVRTPPATRALPTYAVQADADGVSVTVG